MEHKITGVVIEGDHYGRTLGFPTMNLDTRDELPPSGIYSGTAILEGTNYKAAIVIKDIEDEKYTAEAYLLDYSGDAYGKILILTVHKFLRDYKEFTTREELIEQIQKDLEMCK